MAHGAIVYTGYGVQGYRPWGLSAMGVPGGMGYRGMGHMGNRGTGGVWVQGVWATSAMGHMGNGGTWAMGYMGMGNGAPLPMCPIGHVTY